MSYSSKLIALRTLVLQLRALDRMITDSDLTVEEYLSYTELLNKMLELRNKLDEKALVLEVTEDEEGVAIAYELLVRGQPTVPPQVLELDLLAGFSERHPDEPPVRDRAPRKGVLSLKSPGSLR